MVNALAGHPHRDMRDCIVIQGLGAVVDPSRDVHSTELARRLAHFLGGQPNAPARSRRRREAGRRARPS